jgi:aprataxin
MNKTNAWQFELIRIMKDPKYKIIGTDSCLAVKDKFPKATHHFLVLPIEEIDTIYELEKKHIELLNEMHHIGVNTIELVKNNIDNFKIGFHVQPSMKRYDILN